MDRCSYIGVVYDLFNLFPYEGAAMAVLPEIVSVHVLELCVNFLLEYKFGNLFRDFSECPYLKFWVPA
jgi:hypothetical protein